MELVRLIQNKVERPIPAHTGEPPNNFATTGAISEPQNKGAPKGRRLSERNDVFLDVRKI